MGYIQVWELMEMLSEIPSGWVIDVEKAKIEFIAEPDEYSREEKALVSIENKHAEFNTLPIPDIITLTGQYSITVPKDLSEYASRVLREALPETIDKYVVSTAGKATPAYNPPLTRDDV